MDLLDLNEVLVITLLVFNDESSKVEKEVDGIIGWDEFLTNGEGLWWRWEEDVGVWGREGGREEEEDIRGTEEDLRCHAGFSGTGSSAIWSLISMDFNRLGVSDTLMVFPERISSSKFIVGVSGS